jgi:hypothetical protein
MPDEEDNLQQESHLLITMTSYLRIVVGFATLNEHNICDRDREMNK